MEIIMAQFRKRLERLWHEAKNQSGIMHEYTSETIGDDFRCVVCSKNICFFWKLNKQEMFSISWIVVTWTIFNSLKNKQTINVLDLMDCG
jgi:hypothetical protein